jgi:hypothetical protein
MPSIPTARTAPAWLLPLLLVLGALSILPGAWLTALHCDEFAVLRHVTDFAHGDFRSPGRPGLLWTLLAPIIFLDDPVWILRAGRLTALAASVATLLGVWHLAERAGRVDEDLTDSSGNWPWFGLAGVLLLATSLDWQAHSFEIRTDTYVMPLTLLAMALLWRAEMSLRTAVMVGVVIAMTGLFSQKSIYNAVSIAIGWFSVMGVLAWNGRLQLRRQFLAGVVALLTALAVVGLWYGLMTLLTQSDALVTKQMAGATKTAFTSTTSMTDKLSNLAASFDRAPALWGMAVVGSLWSLWQARRRPGYLASLLVAAVMVSTIFIHRGYWTYFIASFCPYLALLAAAAVGGLCRALHARLGAWAGALLLLILVTAQLVHVQEPYKAMLATNNQPQLEVITAAREAFPEPVPYWDAIGLVPGYDEATFFGTSMLRRIFRKKHGNDGFIKLARANKPQFFIRDYMSREVYMRGAELEWAWRHFLPYRHNLYLHGGRVVATQGVDLSSEVELLEGGVYTVWFYGGWQGEAWLDGKLVTHQEQVEVTASKHTLRVLSAKGSGQFWLLLGADRKPETERIADHRDYSLYPYDSRLRYQHYDRRRRSPSDLLTPAGDPTLTEKGFNKRSKRHRKYLMKREKRLGQIAPVPNAAP